MLTKALIRMLTLLCLLGCTSRASIDPSLVGRYGSDRRGLSVELKSDGTFEAGVEMWSSPIGCMLVDVGEATGRWGVNADEVEFFDVEASGQLAQTFFSARIQEGGSVLALSDERLEKGRKPNRLLPSW